MDNELMNLALLSKPQDMIDVARYRRDISKWKFTKIFCTSSNYVFSEKNAVRCLANRGRLNVILNMKLLLNL